MEFNLVDTPDKYWEAHNTLWGKPRLAADTETSVREEWRGKRVSALNVHVSQIEITALKADDTAPYVIDHRILREVYGFEPPLADLFDSVGYLLGANFKFDLKFFYALLGKWFANARDVILMARMISNATGSKFGAMHGHGLADLVRDLLNIHLSGKGSDLQGSDWGLPVVQRRVDNDYWIRKLTYAAGDTEYLFPLEDRMYPVINNTLPRTDLIPDGTDDWDNFGLSMGGQFQLEMETLPVTAMMEYNGVPASKEILTSLQRALTDRLEELAYSLAQYFQLPVDQSEDIFSASYVASEKAKKTLNDPNKLLKFIKGNLNLYNLDNTQTAVLERSLELLDKVGIEKKGPADDREQTKAEAIEIITEEESDLYKQLDNLEASMIFETTPVLKKIVEYRRLKKLEGMDMRKYINPATDRIHANMNQIGTATSRFSCNSPNLQQVGTKTSLPVPVKIDENGVIQR